MTGASGRRIGPPTSTGAGVADHGDHRADRRPRRRSGRVSRAPRTPPHPDGPGPESSDAMCIVQARRTTPLVASRSSWLWRGRTWIGEPLAGLRLRAAGSDPGDRLPAISATFTIRATGFAAMPAKYSAGRRSLRRVMASTVATASNRLRTPAASSDSAVSVCVLDDVVQPCGRDECRSLGDRIGLPRRPGNQAAPERLRPPGDGYRGHRSCRAVPGVPWWRSHVRR